MSIATKLRDALSPSDPVLIEKTLSRLSEQDTWNDVFSTKLIQVLDNIDQLKAELRQSSRATEQRAVDAKKNFDKAAARLRTATRWAIAAIGLSWVGLIWVALVAFRYVVPIWSACTATALIIALAGFFLKRKSHEG